MKHHWEYGLDTWQTNQFSVSVYCMLGLCPVITGTKWSLAHRDPWSCRNWQAPGWVGSLSSWEPGAVKASGASIALGEATHTLLSPSTGRISLSELVCPILGEVMIVNLIFLNLLAIAFPVFVPHPSAIIPYLETLVLADVFFCMATCWNWFGEGGGQRNKCRHFSNFTLQMISSLAYRSSKWIPPREVWDFSKGLQPVPSRVRLYNQISLQHRAHSLCNIRLHDGRLNTRLLRDFCFVWIRNGCWIFCLLKWSYSLFLCEYDRLHLKIWQITLMDFQMIKKKTLTFPE